MRYVRNFGDMQIDRNVHTPLVYEWCHDVFSLVGMRGMAFWMTWNLNRLELSTIIMIKLRDGLLDISMMVGEHSTPRMGMPFQAKSNFGVVAGACSTSSVVHLVALDVAVEDKDGYSISINAQTESK